MPMTRKAALLTICGLGCLGNVILGLMAYGDMRAVCPDGAGCGDAWSNLVLFAGLGVAFAVATALVAGGRIG